MIQFCCACLFTALLSPASHTGGLVTPEGAHFTEVTFLQSCRRNLDHEHHSNKQLETPRGVTNQKASMVELGRSLERRHSGVITTAERERDVGSLSAAGKWTAERLWPKAWPSSPCHQEAQLKPQARNGAQFSFTK